MKKVLALITVVTMVASMAMPVFAAPSPTRHTYSGDPNNGPGVVKEIITPQDPTPTPTTTTQDPKPTVKTKEKTISGEPQEPGSGISIWRYTREDGIDAALILTPYDERSTIIYDKSRSEISEAHAELQECSGELDYLNPTVAEKAEEAGTTVDQCYVSELFDLTYYLIIPEYVQSDDHGTFQITIGREKLENFVCLMHRYNGEWEVVPDAKVTGENMDTLEFSEEFFSPFAVVVWGNQGITYDKVKSPKTNDNTLNLGLYTMGIILSLVATGYVLGKGRKGI